MATTDSSLDLVDIALGELPQRLAEAYYTTDAGDVLTLAVDASLDQQMLRDLVVGAGFVVRPGYPVVGASQLAPGGQAARVGKTVGSGRSATGRLATLQIERIVSLPDRIVPDLRIWFSGLNPSVYAAEAGVGFARPGNRFWPAALESGLMTVDRDPQHALVHHRVGMTDLVKRATAKASEVHRDEFAAGAERLRRVCEGFAPRVLCIAGITGWRAAVDKQAVAGLQADRFGNTQIYVMANPSGLNAHVTMRDIADELRHIATLADAAE